MLFSFLEYSGPLGAESTIGGLLERWTMTLSNEGTILFTYDAHYLNDVPTGHVCFPVSKSRAFLIFLKQDFSNTPVVHAIRSKGEISGNVGSESDILLYTVAALLVSRKAEEDDE
jgi:hypothetical protein